MELRRPHILYILICLWLLVSPSNVSSVWAKDFVVVIDAGHGGHDPGAIGKISKEIIADLCRSDVRPDGWLSHTVYVEEVGEDEKLGDMPFISFLMRDFA